MKKAAILILTVLLLVPSPVSVAAEPSLSARAAILIEAESGRVLYEKNASTSLPMASTTKIMTALLTIESLPLDRVITVPKEAVGTEGTSLYLTEGEKFTVSDLLHALLLRSANDAAVALAIGVSGSVEAFAERMNERARELGLTGTHFENPHGLDSPGHYTTARDLAVLAGEAMQNGIFAQIVGCRQKRLTPEKGTPRVVTNHNKLLRLYGDAVGVKTGFTKKSGRCLVGAAEMNGALFITVTLDAPSDWNDHIALFDLGRRLLERHTPYESGEYVVSLPVIGGKSEYVTVTNTEALSLVEEKDARGTVTAEYNYFATAPVKRGQVLGTLTYTSPNGTVTEVELCAAEDVPAQKPKRNVFERLFHKEQ